MSLIRIIVADKQSVIYGEAHGSEADRVVASLTAEPESINELRNATKRFSRNGPEEIPFGWFNTRNLDEPLEFPASDSLEPVDAGILAIDLFGKTVLIESTYSLPSADGTIGVADRLSTDAFEGEFPLPYQLSNDWEFTSGADDFRTAVRKRRETALGSSPVDYRKILFGKPLIRYIAGEMRKSKIPENEKLRSHLHSLWLVTDRPDLNGRCPREILLDKHDFVSGDLHSRSLQWSFTKDAPPDIPRKSNAYKYAGFGTHEIVVYYDLVRHLMDLFCARLKQEDPPEALTDIEYLEIERDKWLTAPNPEYSGRTPSLIIDYERMRRNITMSAHECIIDENCPICIEMSQIFDTPMFWHLDGSHMDREFAFSFDSSYEEWSEKEAAFEEFINREFPEPLLNDFDEPEDILAELKF